MTDFNKLDAAISDIAEQDNELTAWGYVLKHCPPHVLADFVLDDVNAQIAIFVKETEKDRDLNE